VPAENLLGGTTGKGFYQLMSTYEIARIQTAARAVGVAQAALEAALRYSQERTQFGKPISQFQVIGHKLAHMATQIEAGRQLTYHAARMKDTGKRCDLEAGMAKAFCAEMAEHVTARRCRSSEGTATPGSSRRSASGATRASSASSREPARSSTR